MVVWLGLSVNDCDSSHINPDIGNYYLVEVDMIPSLIVFIAIAAHNELMYIS